MDAAMSKTPSPADLERERRLAEALRANLRKRKVQTKITYKTCCDDGEFNPNELIQTGLGWGQVKDAEYDVQTNTITVNLLQQ